MNLVGITWAVYTIIESITSIIQKLMQGIMGLQTVPRIELSTYKEHRITSVEFCLLVYSPYVT